MSGQSLEHSRRASPRDPVPLRPSRRPVAAARPPASGAALPHADPVVFAAHHAIRPLSQLAAGSAEQLRRAGDVSGKGRRVPGRNRPRRRDGRLQPVRLLPRAVRRTLSVLRTSPRELRELQPFLHAEPLTPRFAELSRRRRSPRGGGRSTSWSTLNRQLQPRHQLRHPARPRRAGHRGDARARVGLVPRHDVAAGAAAAAISASRRVSCPAT